MDEKWAIFVECSKPLDDVECEAYSVCDNGYLYMKFILVYVVNSSLLHWTHFKNMLLTTWRSMKMCLLLLIPQQERPLLQNMLLHYQEIIIQSKTILAPFLAASKQNLELQKLVCQAAQVLGKGGGVLKVIQVHSYVAKKV